MHGPTPRAVFSTDLHAVYGRVVYDLTHAGFYPPQPLFYAAHTVLLAVARHRVR
jgi:hypothetical protein